MKVCAKSDLARSGLQVNAYKLLLMERTQGTWKALLITPAQTRDVFRMYPLTQFTCFPCLSSHLPQKINCVCVCMYV